MRILYFHRTAGDRVEYVHIMGMVNAFRQMGHEVVISSPPGCDPERARPDSSGGAMPAPREGPLRGTLKNFARKAPNVLFEIAELLYNCYALFDGLRQRFRHGKPDLVYERSTSNSIAPTMLARRWKAPIVQEVNVTADTGRLRPLVLKRTTHRIQRWMIRRTALFITVSQRFKDAIAAEGFPPERTIVLHNAINPDEFDPANVEAPARPDAFPPDAFVVGYVGAFVPYHRLDRLIEVAARLVDDYPHLRWLLVGDGVERPKVESLLDEHNLRDRFWLTGKVAHRQVPSYVRSMDVAVLPHSEQFNSPMKLFEYMAMGRPVVVPDVPAVSEVIRDGENGVHFRAGDARALETAIRRILDDEALREHIGARARACVLESHTWIQNARAVLEALQSMAEARKAAV